MDFTSKYQKIFFTLLAANIGYFVTWKVHLSFSFALIAYSFLLVIAALTWQYIKTSLSEEEMPRAKDAFKKLMYYFYLPYVIGSACCIAITYSFILYWS